MRRLVSEVEDLGVVVALSLIEPCMAVVLCRLAFGSGCLFCFFAKELGVSIAASDVAVIIAAFRCVVQDGR